MGEQPDKLVGRLVINKSRTRYTCAERTTPQSKLNSPRGRRTARARETTRPDEYGRAERYQPRKRSARCDKRRQRDGSAGDVRGMNASRAWGAVPLVRPPKHALRGGRSARVPRWQAGRVALLHMDAPPFSRRVRPSLWSLVACAAVLHGVRTLVGHAPCAFERESAREIRWFVRVPRHLRTEGAWTPRGLHRSRRQTRSRASPPPQAGLVTWADEKSARRAQGNARREEGRGRKGVEETHRKQ